MSFSAASMDTPQMLPYVVELTCGLERNEAPPPEIIAKIVEISQPLYLGSYDEDASIMFAVFATCEAVTDGHWALRGRDLGGGHVARSGLVGAAAFAAGGLPDLGVKYRWHALPGFDHEQLQQAIAYEISLGAHPPSLPIVPLDPSLSPLARTAEAIAAVEKKLEGLTLAPDGDTTKKLGELVHIARETSVSAGRAKERSKETSELVSSKFGHLSKDFAEAKAQLEKVGETVKGAMPAGFGGEMVRKMTEMEKVMRETQELIKNITTSPSPAPNPSSSSSSSAAPAGSPSMASEERSAPFPDHDLEARRAPRNGAWPYKILWTGSIRRFDTPSEPTGSNVMRLWGLWGDGELTGKQDGPERKLTKEGVRRFIGATIPWSEWHNLLAVDVRPAARSRGWDLFLSVRSDVPFGNAFRAMSEARKAWGRYF